jgi:hypothetical protein
MHTSPAERILRSLGMPPEDIRAVLVADDPRLVRRHLELHRERLLEELVDRRRTLAALERELTDAALERSRAGRPTGCARSVGLGGRQLDRPVLGNGPERVVGDLPGMTLRIDEDGRVATPERLPGLATDRRTGAPSLLDHRVDLGR